MVDLLVNASSEGRISRLRNDSGNKSVRADLPDGVFLFRDDTHLSKFGTDTAFTRVNSSAAHQNRWFRGHSHDTQPHGSWSGLKQISSIETILVEGIDEQFLI